jgi:hypothetical protein
VVSTIERTEKGAECPKFAPPRLPAPQSPDFQSSTNKRPIVSSFHDLFAFKKPPSPTLKNNQNSSSHPDHDRTTPFPFSDPFAFNHTVSNSSSVPTQIKAFSHSSQDTFAFSSNSNFLPHNVVTSHLQQQFHTDSSSSQFFNPFFFGTNSNLSNHTALASASHKQCSLLTDSSPSLINPATVICNLPTSCSPPNATISSPCRQPAPGRAIRHNMLRPHVSATNRLFSWRTPHGINEDNKILERLPIQLAEAAKLSIMGAFASSSRSTYGAGILRFNQFCDRWAIPESDRMPASYALLCAFIAEHKGSFAGGTIKSWLSGIRAFHLVNQAEWLGDNAWVKMARISANKEGSHHKHPRRAPVSIEHLLALSRVIILSNPFHAAIWAVALTTFFGCRRLGETTVTTLRSFNGSLHVLRSIEYANILHYTA